MSDTHNTPGDEAFLHETNGQNLGETARQAPTGPEFPPTSAAEEASPLAEDLSLILDIPVKMTVELGRTRMTIRELLHLSQAGRGGAAGRTGGRTAGYSHKRLPDCPRRSGGDGRTIRRAHCRYRDARRTYAPVEPINETDHVTAADCA